MNRDKRTISRQELEGQRAYIEITGFLIWLYPLGLFIVDKEAFESALRECDMGSDTLRISGQPLIDELRKRGWTVTEEAGERRYTAREWLERTLPVGGEWRKLGSGCISWHSKDGAAYREGVLFRHNGRIIGACAPVHELHKPTTVELSRSEALDLMAKAIEAGDQFGDSNKMVSDFEAGEEASARTKASMELVESKASDAPKINYEKIAKALGTTLGETPPPSVVMACAANGVVIKAGDATKASPDRGPHWELVEKWLAEKHPDRELVGCGKVKIGDEFIANSATTNTEHYALYVYRGWMEADDVADRYIVRRKASEQHAFKAKAEQAQIERVRNAVAGAMADAEKDIKQMNEINHKVKAEPSKPDLAKAIDSQLYQLVKAMVTVSALHGREMDDASVIESARRILAEIDAK